MCHIKVIWETESAGKEAGIQYGGKGFTRQTWKQVNKHDGNLKCCIKALTLERGGKVVVWMDHIAGASLQLHGFC